MLLVKLSFDRHTERNEWCCAWMDQRKDPRWELRHQLANVRHGFTTRSRQLGGAWKQGMGLQRHVAVLSQVRNVSSVRGKLCGQGQRQVHRCVATWDFRSDQGASKPTILLSQSDLRRSAFQATSSLGHKMSGQEQF